MLMIRWLLEVAILAFFYALSYVYNMELKVEIITLRQLRLAHGLTVEEAAAKCGIASGYWSELETGQRLGMPGKLRRIADAFGLDFYEVVAIVGRSWDQAEKRAARKNAAAPAEP